MAVLGRGGPAVPPSFLQLCFAAASQVTMSWHELAGQCPAGAGSCPLPGEAGELRSQHSQHPGAHKGLRDPGRSWL